jgi:GNAT superfamily N-acetyltransferase
MWIGIARKPKGFASWAPLEFLGMAPRLVEPTRKQVLAFCAEDPVERVFLEETARRGMGRFTALEDDRRLVALCYVGANVVPSGRGCAALGRAAAASARMIFGEATAVDVFWGAARRDLPEPREDRPGQPVYAIHEPPPPAATGLRAAVPGDLPLLLPACAAAHEVELGPESLERDTDGFRWRTEAQIVQGRSWIWVENGTILFKAEASAWTPSAVQLQQVWVDPAARNRGYAKRGLADLCRLLLARVPTVCLFVRRENAPAIRVYEAVGMSFQLTYRSLLF